MGNDISQGNWFPVPSFHVRYQMRASPSPPLSTKTSDKFPDSIRGMRDVWIHNSVGSMKASWQIASGHPQKPFPTPSPKNEAKHFSLPSHWLGFNRVRHFSICSLSYWTPTGFSLWYVQSRPLYHPLPGTQLWCQDYAKRDKQNWGFPSTPLILLVVSPYLFVTILLRDS